MKWRAWHHYEYLLFNLVVLLAPWLAAVVYPGFVFPHWPAAVPAVGLMAVVFIAWDTLVTGRFWHFNPHYITGWRLGNLPVEEVLFFLVIPTSCLMLWSNAVATFPATIILPAETLWVGLLGLLAGSSWAFHRQRWYTGIVLLFALVGLIWHQLAGSQLVLTAPYLIFALLQLLLTLSFNGYLTARPVVTYDLSHATGWKVGSIPAEDLVYGTVMLTLTIALYQLFLPFVR